jgi:hypothetical protein
VIFRAGSYTGRRINLNRHPYESVRITRSLAVCSTAASVVALARSPATANWFDSTTGGNGAHIRGCYLYCHLPPNVGGAFRVSVPAGAHVVRLMAKGDRMTSATLWKLWAEMLICVLPLQEAGKGLLTTAFSPDGHTLIAASGKAGCSCGTQIPRPSSPALVRRSGTTSPPQSGVS